MAGPETMTAAPDAKAFARFGRALEHLVRHSACDLLGTVVGFTVTERSGAVHRLYVSSRGITQASEVEPDVVIALMEEDVLSLLEDGAIPAGQPIHFTGDRAAFDRFAALLSAPESPISARGFGKSKA